MEEKSTQPVINLGEIAIKIWANKRLFYKPLAIVFVLSCIYIFSQPRFYSTEAKLAPEMANNMAAGTLGSIASAFGFDFGDMQTTDAITPLLYPDLMEDNAFVAKLFDINVENQDEDIKTTYYDYLKNHQKRPWWGAPIGWFTNLFKFEDDVKDGANTTFNPYTLSKKDNDIVEVIRGNIGLSVDKKTGVITINVKDQDPRICKTVADSVMGALRICITDYRTNKARTDFKYYEHLTNEALAAYEDTRREYAAMADASTRLSVKSVEMKMEDLENEMQLKYTTYQMLNTQLQTANAKVQERTPVFTILKGAAMPIKPAGPKRMIFVAMMLILAFMVKAFWIVKDDLHFRF